MNKIILIVPAIFALAACSQAKEQIESCTYNMDTQTKTCALTAEESLEVADKVESVGPKVIGKTSMHGVEYDILSNNTLVPRKTKTVAMSN